MKSKKINICFIIDSLIIGGANILTAQVIKYLDKEKFNITILVLSSPDSNNENIVHILNNNAKIINIDLFNFGFIKRFIEIKKNISNCDIIHTCMENSNFYGGLANIIFCRKKIISTVHGIEGVFINDESLKLNFKKKVSRKYIFFVKYLQNYIFKYYAMIISVSEDTKRFLIYKRHLREEKIKVIYHGIDLRNLKQSDNQRINDLKRKYLIKDENIIIGYTGRLTYAKGLEALIDIFAEIKKENEKVKLLLTGDGELKDFLLERIKFYKLESECIITGFVNNVSDFYSLMDIFVLLSKSEGIPLTLLEAMYYGKISLCTSVGGIREIIDDGKNGFLADKDGKVEIKRQIINIINNIENMIDIKHKARNTIAEKFDLFKNSDEIEKTILSVLNS